MRDEIVRMAPGGRATEFEEVPLSAVPAHFVRVAVAGLGEVYVDGRAIAADNRTQHPPFPEAARGPLRRFARVFAEVRPMSETGWEDGFRCDREPWKEIAEWEVLADAFERFTARLTGGDELSQRKRLDVFAVVVFWRHHRTEFGRVRMRAYRTVTAVQANEIGAWVMSRANRERVFARTNALRAVMCDTLLGPPRIPIEALFGDGVGPNPAAAFDRTELVGSAQVVLAVDVATGHERLIFSDAPPGAGPPAGRAPGRTLRVELDVGTDDLEKLVALVQVLKGRDDCT